jgi:UDP-N-acetylglucosamine acyltransferase
VSNDCIMANGALLGGHAVLEDRVFFSGNSAVHQHCRVGTLAMISGISAVTKDTPPFWIMQNFNLVCGVNIVGMRRAGINTLEISAVRKAFSMIYLKKMIISDALTEMETELGQYPSIQKLVAFIRNSKRGICGAACYVGNEEHRAAA